MKKINKSEYDIIVVGAGPAGSTLATQLRKLGHSVLIIDKCRFPREKLCGGLTTYKTIKLIERVFGETESSLVEKGVINYISHNYLFKYKDKPLFKNKTEMKFYFVDRIVYDDFLLKKAKEAGVDVIQGDKVLSYDIEKREIKTASGKKFKGTYIVAADGVNSFLRRMFPRIIYNRRKFQRNLGSTFETFVKSKDINKDILGLNADRPVITLGLVKYGYVWIFPRKDRYAIGIGGLYQKTNAAEMRNALREYLQYLGINPDKCKIKGAFIPLGGYVSHPVYKNIILVGDAGGFVDPTLGEGIFYGQRTAELAAWAIHSNLAEGRPLDKVYRKLLWKYVLPELFNYKAIRWAGINLSEYFHHIPFKIFATCMNRYVNEMLAGSRTNRLFFKRKIHESVSMNILARFLTRPKKK